jgi:hypothetical protein
MFGADHASREIKRNRKESLARAKKRRDKTNMYSASQEKTLKFKEISKEELEQIKIKFREKDRKRKQKITVLTFIFTCVLSYIIYYVITHIGL